MGVFFYFIFHHIAGEVKGSETQGPKRRHHGWCLGGGEGNQEKERSHGWVLQTGALAISAGTATAMAIVWILMQHSLEIHKSSLFLFCPHFTFAGAS
jgi:hypothetical protein